MHYYIYQMFYPLSSLKKHFLAWKHYNPLISLPSPLSVFSALSPHSSLVLWWTILGGFVRWLVNAMNATHVVYVMHAVCDCDTLRGLVCLGEGL